MSIWKIVPIVLVFFIVPASAFASKSYTNPSSFSQKPKDAEIFANYGANLHKDDVDLIVSPGTAPWGAYVSQGTSQPALPIRLCRYWKLSNIPIYEFELRSHYNNALITPQEDTIVSFNFDDEDLRVLPFISFPESSLKIVESDDNGASWSMLKNTVVDEENNTVSAITQLNKGYMLVAGFVSPSVYCNYNPEKVKGAYIPNQEEDVQSVDGIIEVVKYKYTLFQEYLKYHVEKFI